ncbi:uncharacterized protein VP01_7406g1, partial [Puccinia sorghi]
LFCDNQGALALLINAVYQHRTQHLNICHHWFCHHLEESKNFVLEYVRTEQNLSDFLTKPLAPGQHALQSTRYTWGISLPDEQGGLLCYGSLLLKLEPEH